MKSRRTPANPESPVKDLEVIYQTEEETVRAVNGVFFSLKKGEAIGIVGETGAGKTTLPYHHWINSQSVYRHIFL